MAGGPTCVPVAPPACSETGKVETGAVWGRMRAGSGLHQLGLGESAHTKILSPFSWPNRPSLWIPRQWVHNSYANNISTSDIFGSEWKTNMMAYKCFAHGPAYALRILKTWYWAMWNFTTWELYMCLASYQKLDLKINEKGFGYQSSLELFWFCCSFPSDLKCFTAAEFSMANLQAT